MMLQALQALHEWVTCKISMPGNRFVKCHATSLRSLGIFSRSGLVLLVLGTDLRTTTSIIHTSPVWTE